MGGIPTNMLTQVTRDAANTVVPGLYAAGETACVSVHGANRLGTNSLVDLLVFGRRAGRQMAADVKGVELPAWPTTSTEPVRAELEAICGRAKGERKDAIRTDLADVMMDNVGVYRDDAGLRRAQTKVAELRERVPSVSVDDKGTTFNTDLLEARELGYLLDCAETTRRGRACPQGEPRRAQPRGLPGPRRRQLPDPLAGDAGGTARRA